MVLVLERECDEASGEVNDGNGRDRRSRCNGVENSPAWGKKRLPDQKKEIQHRRLEVVMIVFCHCGGEREWTEVLEAGAFDLLAPPYSSSQILALMEHARASGHTMKEYCLS